ncbi:MAG: hypothetical protein MUC92_00900 [Fimbriimonadaceae bacterium]|jgi:hypothetical protein|nr:hypothetical protein [Fimbriimonadaceae bacterium]
MFDPSSIAILIPIVALCIPIVAILTAHQRRMAEIIHANNAHNVAENSELQALRYEIAQLRELVTSQALAVEQLRSEQRIGQASLMANPVAPPSAAEQIQARLTGQ